MTDSDKTQNLEDALFTAANASLKAIQDREQELNAALKEILDRNAEAGRGLQDLLGAARPKPVLLEETTERRSWVTRVSMPDGVGGQPTQTRLSMPGSNRPRDNGATLRRPRELMVERPELNTTEAFIAARLEEDPDWRPPVLGSVAYQTMERDEIVRPMLGYAMGGPKGRTARQRANKRARRGHEEGSGQS